MRKTRGLKLRPHYLGIGGIFVAMVGIVVSVAAVSGGPEESHAAGQGIQNGMYMQDITSEVCMNTPVGDAQYTVKDKRDEKEYTIARIANKEGGGANCWMTSNLAFDIKNQSAKMTTEFSDVTADKTSWASGAAVQNGKFSNGSFAVQYTNSTPTTITGGSYYQTSYGYYYSWCAATAGTCSIAITDQPGVRSADMSICPRGWKLPTGGNGGEFADLLGADTGNSGITVTPHPTSAPYNYLLSGYMDTSGFLSGGADGFYWSSSSSSSNGAYVLGMGSSVVWPVNINNRYSGRSVRCVAEAPSGFGGVYAMQDMTADICAKVDRDTTGSLVDRRNNKIYSVAKIRNQTNDEKSCWMTSNLALDLNEAGVVSVAESDTEVDWPDSAITPTNGAFSSDNTVAQYSTNGAGSSSYDSKYGYYYSWCAATASTCSEATSDTAQPAIRSASQSICPKGWKLPTGGDGGQFVALFGSDIGDKGITVIPHATAAPYNYQLTGFVGAGLSNTGFGYYWSSSSSSLTSAYRLRITSSTVWPANNENDDRHLGFPVRCVADPDRHSASGGSDSNTAGFSVVVNDAITLSGVEFSNSDGTSNTISAMPGQLATGSINVNVGSNVKYKITMNSQSPDLASKTDGNTNVIPSITTTMTADQLKANYGWGVLKKNTDNTTDDTVYTGLNSTDQTFYTSDEPAGASKVTSFGVGVGVPPTIPADTYSTEVTITAIATE